MAVVLQHFFPLLAAWLGDVRDPRQSGRAGFPIKVLLLLGILMFLSHSGSRNYFNDNVRDALEMTKTLARMLGCELDALPHLDTLEKVLRLIQPDDLEKLLAKMIHRLIRMKALDDWRVQGRFLLAIDGTGIYSFRNRHCEHCIESRHESGAITYSHKLLVAFIVSEDGYALPIACEWIENPGTVYKKQDCEIKAFHRLESKLKRLYPQTPFWLLLDALYADQNVLRGAFENRRNVAVTFLDTDMPALWAEAQGLLRLSPGQSATLTFPKDEGTREIRWINDLEYEGMKLSAIFQVEKDKAGNVLCQFAHLVGLPIDS
ncbi:MAG TPA: transposase family protein, partial [Candidatus Binatia bacterium]|nr:transposase family protein [Candidatus Binatia bacterium]